MSNEHQSLTVGQRLKLARLARNWTQQQLADAADYKSPGTISAFESGSRDCPPTMAYRLAQAMGVAGEWLLAGKGEPGIDLNSTKEARQEARAITTKAAELQAIASAAATMASVPLHSRASVAVDDGASDFTWSDLPLERIGAPPAVIAIQGSYAVLLDSDAMHPRYQRGELLFVIPNRPARPGDFVLLRLADGTCIVRELVRRSGDAIAVISYDGEYPNNKAPTSIPLRQIKAMDIIWGTGQV